jgi:hypothetical protein
MGLLCSSTCDSCLLCIFAEVYPTTAQHCASISCRNRQQSVQQALFLLHRHTGHAMSAAAGLAIPWAMFVTWDGAILGSLNSLRAAATTPAAAVAATQRPVQAVQVSSAAGTAAVAAADPQVELAQAYLQQLLERDALLQASQLQAAGMEGIASAAEVGQAVQHGSSSSSTQLLYQVVQSAALPAAPHLLEDFSLASSSGLQRMQVAEAVSTTSDSSSSSVVLPTRVEDPLAALSAANPVAAPLIQVRHTKRRNSTRIR